ncbi:MAG TPA: chemotaxis protein CheD [Rhizomicrobium sp.]|nr:chemotaxis protein CheD [Rhizomicrobium sp.]
MSPLAARKPRVSAPPGPRRYFSAQEGCWYVQITQGENHVTGEPREVLTTILGSCVSACIRDREFGVGGMNHFLLPEGGSDDRDAQRYGVNAMELLINGLLKHGASRRGLEAKLFGGANVLAGLSDVGSRNAAFARQFLLDEGIPLVGGDVGGTMPRRIQFWPTTGRARQLALGVTDVRALGERELSTAERIRRHEAEEGNDVDLF